MYYKGIKNKLYLEHEREQARQRSRKKTGRIKDVSWYAGEKHALEILKGSTRAYGTKYDLEWNGFRIDIKTAQLTRSQSRYKENTYTGSWAWKFRVEKQRGIVDFFLCIGLGEKKEILKIFLIPDSEMKVNSPAIGFKKSKYDPFLIKGLFGIRV